MLTVRQSAGDLEDALRSGSDTPIVGSSLGAFAESVAGFGSELAGLSGLLGEFEAELGALGDDLRNTQEAAAGTLQADLERWMDDPYDAEWPPADPERRPAEVGGGDVPQPATRAARESGRQSVGSTTAASSADGPEPTRQAILGGVASQVTEEPQATEEAGGSLPVLRGGGVEKVKYSSVSTMFGHTCGVRTDGAVACWGIGPQAMPPEGEFASVS